MIKICDVPYSLWATALFRLAGARSAIVTVDGWRPVLLTAGSIKCGRLSLRCKTIPIELGAGSNGSLVLGERVFINTGATVVANHSITLGDDCRLGDLVAIFDSDHHPAGAVTSDPDRASSSRCQRLGRSICDDPSRRNHWRPRCRRGRIGRDGRRSGQDGCGRRTSATGSNAGYPEMAGAATE